MAKEKNNKCGFIFLSTENVLRSLELGLIGYKDKVDDLPDGDFVIADSLRQVLLGPFRTTVSQYHSPKPVIFYAGTSNLKEQDCHWLMGFAPHPVVGGIDRGSLWPVAADVMGVSNSHWSDIQECRPTQDQFHALCNELVRINLEEDFGPGVVGIGDLYRSDKEWALFLESIDGGRFQDWVPNNRRGDKHIPQQQPPSTKGVLVR